MNGNKLPFVKDPEGFEGNYVGAGNIATPIKNEYDIRAFVKFKRDTGKEWNDLTAKEREKFKLQ